MRQFRAWSQNYGAIVALVGLIGTLIGLGATVGRMTSLEARTEAHLREVPAEARASAALNETVKAACARIERMEGQLDDLHNLLMRPRTAAASSPSPFPSAAAAP